jgi:peptide-methionine (S)-S-oxide reductase
MGLFTSRKTRMVEPERALQGRAQATEVSGLHLVLGTKLTPPFPDHLERAIFAMGCFWGAERDFWVLPGVYATAVGYTGGLTANPTYREVCSGKTGHAEAVLVVFGPTEISYEKLLSVFFEGHDPTQIMRQGNDVGTQYRSAIFTTSPAQAVEASKVTADYREALKRAHRGEIATQITPTGEFYYAEGYHQQYLEANPGGYCGVGGTGVPCPAGLSDVQ